MGLIWGSFWSPQMRNSPVFGDFLKQSPKVPHQSWFTCLLGVRLGVFELCAQKPLFLGLELTHWGRVMHICVNNLTIIGSDNGLSPDRRQAIIWTNAGILLIEPLGTNFSEILIWIQIFSFKKMCLKMSSAKWRPFCLGLNVLRLQWRLLGHQAHVFVFWCYNILVIILYVAHKTWKSATR